MPSLAIQEREALQSLLDEAFRVGKGLVWRYPKTEDCQYIWLAVTYHDGEDIVVDHFHTHRLSENTELTSDMPVANDS